LVRAAPGATALIDTRTGRKWSRRDLDEIAQAWAPAPDQPLDGRLVLFAEPNGADWLRVFLGLLRAGAIAAALDPGEPAAWQAATARKLGASHLWTAGRLERIDGRRARWSDGRRLVKITSGSSGEPRGLPFTEAQMLADGRQICASMGIGPNDVNLGLVPFGHSYGLGNLVIPLVSQGTAVVCPAGALPHALAEAAERWRPTVFPAVPAVLRAMVEVGIDPAAIRSLRTVISAGSPLAPELARAYQAKFGVKIHNFYGSSETGGIAFDRTGEATLDGRGLGAPLRGVRLAYGARGRFTVTSPAVFTLGNRRGNSSPGTHSPADLARPGAGGILKLLGRAGRALKVGGHRLNPAEIEREIRLLPGVVDALVVPHPGRPDVLAAAVAGPTTAASVRDALAARLASWKVPRKFLLLPEFPLTGRGKPDRRRLRELLGG